ncbi:MAG: thioredoxin-dependent thiol peroxidase [Candidatus Marinimicrobia bacterium]|nr:thioredoxin-dependent thiol peroxidase [Candidatus Neomarinimicrobiota bacterium]
MSFKVGDKAPNFTLRDQNGNSVSLDSFLGKKVIVFFYPKDDTPGCTVEVCNFRDDFEMYEEKNAVLLGISKDGEDSHKKFISKFDLPFRLLCDEDHAVAEEYGAWVEKSMYGRKYMGIMRTTVVVDAEGKIEQIFEKVNPKDHSKDLLGML